MKLQKISRVLTAAAVTMMGMTAACQAASLAPASDKSVRTVASVLQPVMTAPTLKPTVMIGTASLEEYSGGNPASRTLILRDESTARQSSTDIGDKNHS